MSQSIDRLTNLIRVLRGVAPGDLNMSNWCECAVGHACRDRYFIDEGLSIVGLGEHPMAGVAAFFGIESDQSYRLFLSSGYVGPAVLGHLPASAKMPTPADVIARLQALLLEKRAAEAVAEGWGGLTKSGDGGTTIAPQAARELEPVS